MYAHIVSIQKNMLRTSLRSDTHATDSTCNGCNANNAATHALRQCAPVNRRNSRNNSTVLAACRSTFVRCGPAAPGPNNCASNMRDSHVSGCQLAAYPV